MGAITQTTTQYKEGKQKGSSEQIAYQTVEQTGYSSRKGQCLPLLSGKHKNLRPKFIHDNNQKTLSLDDLWMDAM